MLPRILALSALALALPFTCLEAAPAKAAAPQIARQAPGYYRVMLGTFEVTALLDGTHTFPIPTVLQRPGTDDHGSRELLAEAQPGEAEARLAHEALALPFEGSINAFLVNTGTKLVMIDTGAGALYGACCGKLLANLRAAGYTPEQVDEVLLTHLHADHVGSVMLDGRAAFPNATIRAGRKDLAYWLDARNEGTAPRILLPMFEGAQKVLKPYADAGRLQPLDDGDEPVPGFRAIATPGHTPGHTSFA